MRITSRAWRGGGCILTSWAPDLVLFFTLVIRAAGVHTHTGSAPRCSGRLSWSWSCDGGFWCSLSLYAQRVCSELQWTIIMIFVLFCSYAYACRYMVMTAYAYVPVCQPFSLRYNTVRTQHTYILTWTWCMCMYVIMSKCVSDMHTACLNPITRDTSTFTHILFVYVCGYANICNVYADMRIYVICMWICEHM